MPIQASSPVWQPLRAPNSTIPPKPVKGIKTQSFYGRVITTRTSDHTADAHVAMMRNDYNHSGDVDCYQAYLPALPNV